jgi:hypothetical protein
MNARLARTHRFAGWRGRRCASTLRVQYLSGMHRRHEAGVLRGAEKSGDFRGGCWDRRPMWRRTLLEAASDPAGAAILAKHLQNTNV